MYIQEAEALTGRGAPQSSSNKHVPIGREKGAGKETRQGYRFSTEPPPPPRVQKKWMVLSRDLLSFPTSSMTSDPWYNRRQRRLAASHKPSLDTWSPDTLTAASGLLPPLASLHSSLSCGEEACIPSSCCRETLLSSLPGEVRE